MMPAPGGIEVCQRLRRQPEHAGLPILLLTALDRPEDKARGLEAGANDFLSKPFDESELSARLRSLLRTKALQDRLADLLGRYVSENVAAEVLRDPFAVSLGGDRRQVSTLFADVRGYTALAAEHPPETTLDLLNRYLTVVSDAVERPRRHRRRLPRRRGLRLLRRPGDPRRRSRAGRPGRARHAGRGRCASRSRRCRACGCTLGIGITTRRGDRRQRRVGAPHALHRRRRPGERRVAPADGGRTGADPRRRARRTSTSRDLVASQDLGSLRLAGKSDWVRAFNVLALQPALP